MRLIVAAVLLVTFIALPAEAVLRPRRPHRTFPPADRGSLPETDGVSGKFQKG